MERFVKRFVKRFVLFGGFLLMMAAPAAAQTQTYNDYRMYFPGSMWSSFGRMLTPTEPHNISGIIHVEQGIAYRGAELYVQGEGWADRFDLDWNNRYVGGMGVRFTQSLRGGLVRGGIIYLADHRRLRHTTYTHGLTLFVESWFGWGREQVAVYTFPAGGR